MIFNLMKPVPTTESATIPEGGTYYVGVTSTSLGVYTGATATYTGGDNFPETVSVGDVYVYGDYEYRYGMEYSIWANAGLTSGKWVEFNADSYNANVGWGVRVIDTEKISYENMLSVVNGENVTNLVCTYCWCKNMVVAPSISKHAEILGVVTSSGEGTVFWGCSSMTTAPVIPQSVIWMDDAFAKCTALTGDITVNANPSSVVYCFNDTIQPIFLIGDSTLETKERLAATAPNGNVTYQMPMAYSYNGTILPALPTWDKESYPYAVIVGDADGSNSVTPTRLILSTVPLHYASNNTIYPFLLYGSADGACIGYEWTSPIEGIITYEPGFVRDESLDSTFFTGGRASGRMFYNDLVWANYDVYDHANGTTLVLSACDEPIPVYE